MATNQQNHQELAAHLRDVLGTSYAPPASFAAAPADATDKQTRHLVSEASSVVSSSNSLSSSSASGAPLSLLAADGAGSNDSGSSGSWGLNRGHAIVVPAAPPGETKATESPQQPPFLVAAGGSVAPAVPSDGRAVPTPAPVGLDPVAMHAMHMHAPPHPVAEFLFQLTKMLTDNNSEYIEWRHASIFVHDPPGLEKDILPKYFRHSNYSSFQRQMNYFGFRKIAGKGKMSPCSYVNEAAKEDISSLLFIKRKKAGASSAAAKLLAQQNRINRSLAAAQIGTGNLMMGNTLGTLPNALPANSNLSFTLPNALPANSNLSFNMSGGAGNIMPATASSLNQANTLLQQQQQQLQLQQQQQQQLQLQQQQQQQQQNILAQLQQAHASALMNSQVQDANLGGNPPGALNNVFNPGSSMNTKGENNAPLMTTIDQGNLTNLGYPADWSTPADAVEAQQSLLLQQATQGIGGNFSQGMGGVNGTADSNGLVRLDSSADLRALLNQQISMFDGPVGDLASAVGNLGAPLAAALPSAGMAQPQGSSAPKGAGLNSIPTADPSQGVSLDWNEMLKFMGGEGSVDNPSVQQLLQGSNNVTPGPAATTSQSFNLINGLFAPGYSPQEPTPVLDGGPATEAWPPWGGMAGWGRCGQFIAPSVAARPPG